MIAEWIIFFIFIYLFYFIFFFTTALENREKLEEMKRILHDELPDDNYYILKYVVNFLTEVGHPFRVIII